MNSAKVVLGFLELAFALKFLSTADMVWQYHILNRELFIAIWAAISFITAMYLFGGFRLPNDSKIEFLGVGRMLLGSMFLIISFYLLPGIFGAPVKIISGFPPPLHYSEKYGSESSNSGSEIILASLWPVISSSSKTVTENFFFAMNDNDPIKAAGISKTAVDDLAASLPFIFLYP